jgi:DNA-binding MarR family transcriptional regulator
MLEDGRFYHYSPPDSQVNLIIRPKLGFVNMEIPAMRLFRLAYNQASLQVSAAVAEVVPEQRPSFGNVMEQLDHEDGMRLTDLASGAGMSPQSIGELVDQLEHLGMVERRPDPTDRRAKRVYMTERARVAQRTAREAVEATDRRIAEALGRDGLERLKADLVRVIEALGGSLPPAPGRR